MLGFIHEGTTPNPGWNNKRFSLVGCVVLIKLVLQEILTYMMSSFILPSFIIHEAE